MIANYWNDIDIAVALTPLSNSEWVIHSLGGGPLTKPTRGALPAWRYSCVIGITTGSKRKRIAFPVLSELPPQV
jgi:hypothetical protein